MSVSQNLPTYRSPRTPADNAWHGRHRDTLVLPPRLSDVAGVAVRCAEAGSTHKHLFHKCTVFRVPGAALAVVFESESELLTSQSHGTSAAVPLLCAPTQNSTSRAAQS